MSSNMVTLRCPACNAPFPSGSSNKREIRCPYCGQVTYNNFALRNPDAINMTSVVLPGCTDDDVKRYFIEELVRTDYVPVDIFDSFSIEDIRHNMYPVYLFNVNWSANWSAVFSHQISHQEPTYDFNGKRTGTQTVFETEYRDANGTSAGDSRVALSGLMEGFPNQSKICESYSWSTVIDTEFPEIEAKDISDVDSEDLKGWKLTEPNLSSEEAWKNGGKDIVEADVDRQVTRDSRSMSAGWIVDSHHYTYRYSEGKGQCVLLPIWEADYQYANKEYMASVDSWTGEVYLEQYPKDETVEGLKEKTDEEISSTKASRTIGYVFFGIFSALTILFLALPSFSENRIAFSAMLILAIVSWVLTRLAQRKKLNLKNTFNNKLWNDKIKRKEAAEKRFGISGTYIGKEPKKRTLEFGVDAMVYVLFGIVFFIAITLGLFAGINRNHQTHSQSNHQSSTTTTRNTNTNNSSYHKPVNSTYHSRQQTSDLNERDTRALNSSFEYLMNKDASSYSFTKTDLSSLSPKELSYLRNHIYAVHGYVFKSQELNDYFSQFRWYHPDPSVTSSVLNSTEKANAEFINNYQKEYGRTYKLDSNSNLKLLKVVNVEFNNSLAPQSGYSYYPSNLCDGNTATAWAVDLDEAIYDDDRLFGPVFSVRCKNLSHIIIRNGYCKNDDSFRNNTRAAKIVFYNPDCYDRCILFDGSLRDTSAPQKLEISSNIEGNSNIKRIGMDFYTQNNAGFYKGAKWNDLCISEVEFWGYE